ncbi:MAG: hypothetical protein ACREMA_06160 [Longimicrobiales bacterium]
MYGGGGESAGQGCIDRRLMMFALAVLVFLFTPHSARAQATRRNPPPPVPYTLPNAGCVGCATEPGVCHSQPVFDRAGAGGRIVRWLKRGDHPPHDRQLAIVDSLASLYFATQSGERTPSMVSQYPK